MDIRTILINAAIFVVAVLLSVLAAVGVTSMFNDDSEKFDARLAAIEKDTMIIRDYLRIEHNAATEKPEAPAPETTVEPLTDAYELEAAQDILDSLNETINSLPGNK